MTETSDDPREVPWHPRFAQHIVGHETPVSKFKAAFESGRPHHAWMFVGAKGVGKATVAYKLAKDILGPKAKSWIEAGAHPDFLVLQRTLNDSKPARLRSLTPAMNSTLKPPIQFSNWLRNHQLKY
jgi:DNA polymerase III subunit delta'